MIDFHSHIYPDAIAEKATMGVEKFYDIEMDRVGTVSALLESGDEAGIGRFVVHSVATTPKQVSSINRFVSEQCTLYPDRLIGFGTLHPKLEDFGAALDELESLSLRGVKIHPDFQTFYIDDPALYPMYEQISERGLPVLFHTGDYRYDYSNPRRFRNLLENFPKLVAIGAHFGGWSVWDEAEEILADTHCYVDTSSSLYTLAPERGRALVRRYGAERVLFGVDFPMWGHKNELERIDALKLGSEELDLIFEKNALRILGEG